MVQTNSAIDIARQTLMQLSKNKQLPTPDNFRDVYNEIAGVKAVDNSVNLGKTLQKVLHDAGKRRPIYSAAERAITPLIEKQDWTKLEEQLHKLFSTGSERNKTEANWSVIIRTLLKQLEISHKGVTLSRKKEGLSRVLGNFTNDSDVLGEKIQALIKSWGDEAIAIETQNSSQIAEAPEPEEPKPEEVVQQPQAESTLAKVTNEAETAITAKWRDMMLETFELELIPNLESVPDTHKKAQKLLTQMQKTTSEPAISQHAQELKNILLTLEMQRDTHRRINDSLLSLLRLMTKSMDEMVIEDEWLHSQLHIINDIVNKPININTLFDAESSLKDLIYKQKNLKPAMHDAKDTLKQMVATFVNSLAGLTESTSDYHAKIEGYQEKLISTEEIGELNSVLKNILEDTRNVGLNVQRSRDEFQESQKKAIEAEQKIKELTAELDHISEVAHEDYLTGTLNRRGMDEALEREFNRADRYNTTLSIAMMDIDHFKKLNDNHGHAKGDEALTHFAKVIKDVKRTTDVLARYGGEEFIIILPATEQADAINVITRVQRELTKNFFMSNDERVLITFSAGVAERIPGESPESIVPRADAALYQAKNTGRNRVVGAEIANA